MKHLARRRHAQEGEHGFTLVEMVISVALIAVIFAALAAVLHSGLRALAVAKTRAQANDLATQGIEDLQRFGFNNLGVCAPSSYASAAPSGLEDVVQLPNCPSPLPSPASGVSCDSVNFGTLPAYQYTCTRRNISYVVRRYVAWADAVKQSKRLAVFVDWTDTNGEHQVSQQSSLRAPDQAAITGLAPPRFKTSPAPSVTVTPPGDNDGPVLLLPPSDANAGQMNGGQIVLDAHTENLVGPAATSLASAIGAHQAGGIVDVTVASFAGFPPYNGFPVTIGQSCGVNCLTNVETFRVIAGAGSASWRLVADGNLTHAAGEVVSFAGDQVYATIQTLDSDGNLQSSSIRMVPNGGENIWRATILSTDGYRFGPGSQYVAFGILRAADGKTSAAFATPAVEFCYTTGCGGNLPTFVGPPSVTPTPVVLDSAGGLTGDVTVTATTRNMTSSDTVTVSFVTGAGAVSVLLSPDSGCPTPPDYDPVIAPTCTWSGTIQHTAGYRFAPGTQSFYFGARQIVQPGTIDNGSTGAASTDVTFA